MTKIIQSVRIRKDRAEILKNKAMELTVKKKEYIKETDIINYLIDEFTTRLDVDIHGIFTKEEEQ